MDHLANQFSSQILSIIGNLFINVVLANFSIRDWTTDIEQSPRKCTTVHGEMVDDSFGYYFK